jgi:hypothetical protein
MASGGGACRKRSVGAIEVMRGRTSYMDTKPRVVARSLAVRVKVGD